MQNNLRSPVAIALPQWQLRFPGGSCSSLVATVLPGANLRKPYCFLKGKYYLCNLIRLERCSSGLRGTPGKRVYP